MMADLIDRQAAKDVIHKRLGTMDLFESRFNADIDAIPAADAVEVVRCKDCKHWLKDVAGCTDNVGRCEWANYMVGAAGYCVYGERRGHDG